MRISHLTALVLSILVFACGEKDATAFDPTGQEWEFSLSNPPPVVLDTNLPLNLQKTPRWRHEIFSPGDVLRVVGDSILVENELKASFFGRSRKFLLLSAEEIPDTLAGFRLSQGVGTSLSAAFFMGDSLLSEWLFEKKREIYQDIAFGELDGQTFRCAFPDGDTMQVYFGTSVRAYGRDEGKKYEYFISEKPDFLDERSYIEPDGFRYWGSRMSNMRNDDMRFRMAREGFSSKPYHYGRDKDGTVVASYIEITDEKYNRIDMPLVPVPARFASGAAEADFADRINSGVVRADNTYPPIDSADVSYQYQEDYKGIEYDELSELEFSAEPGGEFIAVVRDRLLMNRQWKLSPDGHYLITMGKNGVPNGHYPILAYTDEHIDLRIPFTVKTREPRGVKLESYAGIDVFIRIARRTNATSR